MGDYCLRFNVAAMEVHDLTEENGRLQKRIAELDAKIADIRDIAENTVEINMGNFNDDDVSEQNNALIEIWQILDQSEGDADECPSCKGNDKNSRLVMDATLGMDYECSDDWHTSEEGADVEVTKYKLFGLTVGTRRHVSEGDADE